MSKMKIISGGQTGADRAGLIAAKFWGLDTGGWMPLGFKALDGFHPEFAKEFNIRQTGDTRYTRRTEMNVYHSDVTIRFATNWKSRGELFTLRCIAKFHKPYHDFTPNVTDLSPEELAIYLRLRKIKVVNVAGNSEQTSPGIQLWTTDFLKKAFAFLQ